MMDDLKSAVLGQMGHGQSHAVTGALLARRLGFKNDRAIRLAIRELIRDGVPVASSVRPPLGFFIIQAREEALEYMAVLKGRLVEDALRRRDFKRAAREKIRPPEQLVLIR